MKKKILLIDDDKLVLDSLHYWHREMGVDGFRFDLAPVLGRHANGFSGDHPLLVQIGDEIEVVVLGINKDKQEISLGVKQTQANPWDQVSQRYPEGATVKGKVRNLTNYGAFIEIEEGIDGLLHVSDMSWTRKISHPSEMLEKNQEVECRVLTVDQARQMLGGAHRSGRDPGHLQKRDRKSVV